MSRKKTGVPFRPIAVFGLLAVLAAGPGLARSCPSHLAEPCFFDLQRGKVTGPTDPGAGAPFYLRPPAVADGAYKVCVSDQYASFGQPLGDASTPNGQALFALPDPFDGNTDLIIGLNRVIHALFGLPSGNRVGTGLQRAYVTIE